MIRFRIFNFILSKILAFKRRIYIFIFGDFDPYPKHKYISYSPSDYYLKKASSSALKLDLGVENIGNDSNWQNIARKKFTELIHYNENLQGTVVDKMQMPIKGEYNRTRYIIKFDERYHIPVDIIKRKDIENKKGIVICLQGTNSGANLNIGKVRMPDDYRKIYNGAALALQAADNGFTAVSFDRIGYGERRESKYLLENNNVSVDLGYHSLILGSTLLGDNVSEVSAVMKVIKKIISSTLPIWIVGYSAAGTVALASAAVDSGVDGIAVGGCLGFERDTILKRRAGGLNNIPNLLDWFQQDAQVSLIAPRPSIYIAGVNDHIWPFDAAEKVIESAKKIYLSMSAEEDLILIKADGPHTYYPELMWPAVNKYF